MRGFSQYRGLVLALTFCLLSACAQLGENAASEAPAEVWRSGDYALSLNDDGLKVRHQGQTLAHIEQFEFNFIPAVFDRVVATQTDGVTLRLTVTGSDGYEPTLPDTVELVVRHRDGHFHFEAAHPSFRHIGITLADQDEHYYGLIEKLYPDNRKSPDLRGETVDVEVYHQGERDFAENYASAFSSFYISTAGYGSFFDTFAKGEYRFAQRGQTRIYHQTDKLDWHLFHGPGGSRIHQKYYNVIGAPKSIPLWALGPVVWRDHNTGKDEILEDMQRFAELEIPLTATFVDRPYSDGGHEWSKMNFAEPFANPEQWIGTLNDDFGLEVMSWVGPMTFGDKGFPGLLPNHRTYIDLTHPEALVEFERRMQTQQYQVGIKGHKMDRADENFPFTAQWHDPVSESETRNTYAYLYSKVIDQLLRGAHGDDQFNFARTAIHRTQPFLSAVWGGDVRPNWQGMAGNQANAMRASFMGFPVWGTDTGGYLGDGYIDEKLYARWLQWGAWNGMFEVKLDGIGGQGEDRVPWRYSERLQKVFRQVSQQRIAMIPYSYSLANTSAQNGVLMKPMAYVYPQDERTHQMWDQYLFGDAFLVAPLFGPEDEREIYLPEGRWYDFNDPTQTFAGEQMLTRDYAFDQTPVFIRANSLHVTGDIYRGSDRRWRGELKGKGELTIHAYPGDEGEKTTFTYVDPHQGNQHKPMTLSHSSGVIGFEGPALMSTSVLRVRLDQKPDSVTVNEISTNVRFLPDEGQIEIELPKGRPLDVRVVL
ncbi:alpha-glucosidase (family GH31 glycosyl hydrolase) [Marinimicrobium koreense]|uniref:Alpha-glucosidase (Family GH31 glycosyl hydrolase) n=1 Tax=Marinimicrobium koreense TaxID=306545 RepID=A0A3N1PA85_9GAMM|nr:TIM-barrel domain-containing protein [Marinimicrobium koreense]ROQ21596.1 alpha-glucosidase (family GH31 glycosyl hydrolase) [Marinimicrobium koreense]